MTQTIDWNEVARDLSAMFELPFHSFTHERIEKPEMLYVHGESRGFLWSFEIWPENYVRIETDEFWADTDDETNNPDKGFWLLLYARSIGFDVSALEADFKAHFSAHDLMEWRQTFLERLRLCGIDEAPFRRETNADS